MTAREPAQPVSLGGSTVRFAAVGVLNTLITLGVIFALKALAGAGDVLANAAGYAVGLVVSFVLNRKWTFRHEGPLLPALLRFSAAVILAYACNLAAVLALIGLGVNEYASHMAGMPVYTVVFFVAARLFVFTGPSPIGGVQAAVEGPDRRISSGEHTQARHAMLAGRVLPWLTIAGASTAWSLFYGLGSPPLALWDESRVAVNALEMAIGGWSLVTTYGGVPDTWNTKPPLLVWLIAASIHWFGSNEWAVRLPSAIASFCTAMLVFAFVAVHLRRPIAACVSVLLLLATPVYMFDHGARAADYDALLTFFTTGYLLAFLLYLHGPPQDRNRWLALAAASIALACLTKSIQGLIFLPAVLAYALMARRASLLLAVPRVWVSMSAVVGVVVTYLLLREAAEPGHFANVMGNDLQGRFTSAQEDNAGGPLYYLTLPPMRSLPWLVPGLLAAAWLWRTQRDAARPVAAMLGLVTVFYLVIISVSRTKLPWYAIPLVPPMAICLALALDTVMDSIAPRMRMRLSGALTVAASLMLAGVHSAYAERQLRLAGEREVDAYSLFLRSDELRSTLSSEGSPRDLIVAHPGYPSMQEYYVAPTLFYATVLEREGWNTIVRPLKANPQDERGLVIACGTVARSLSTLSSARVLVGHHDCSLYSLGLRS